MKFQTSILFCCACFFIQNSLSQQGNGEMAAPLIREKAILEIYRAEYPSKPDGPNLQPMQRFIVTLKVGVPAVEFFNRLNGFHFTQQWCLLPDSGDGIRIGFDTSISDEEEGIPSLFSKMDIVEKIEIATDSSELNRVLGEVVAWREGSNAAPFQLLASHVTPGLGQKEVLRLLGKPKQRTELAGELVWKYGLWLGPHYTLEVIIKFDQNDRVQACETEGRVAGMPPPVEAVPEDSQQETNLF